MPQLAQIIEFHDPAGDVLAVRLPPAGDGAVAWGSQLIVREGQVALLQRDGRAVQAFGPGRYKLDTENVPVLTKLVMGMAYGMGNTPFRAEVYFVALHLFRDLRWGTPEPVYIPDPVLMQVPVRGHGRFTLRVADPPLFVAKMVGTRAIVRTGDVEEFLRSQYLVSALVTATASLGRPLNELARYYRELGIGVRSVLTPEFAGLGLELTDLSVNSVTTTEEVQAMMTGHSQTAGEIYLAQQASATAAAAAADAKAGSVAKIRQLKELLDLGAITKDEFEAKKAELLRQM